MARVTTNPVKVAMDLAPGILLKSVEHAEGVCEDLAKAKYTKREATGNPERPWKYTYDTPADAGAGAAAVGPNPAASRAHAVVSMAETEVRIGDVFNGANNKYADADYAKKISAKMRQHGDPRPDGELAAAAAQMIAAVRSGDRDAALAAAGKPAPATKPAAAPKQASAAAVKQKNIVAPREKPPGKPTGKAGATKRPRAKRIPGGKSPSPAHTAAWGKLGEALKQGPGALAAMSVAAFVMVREYMKGIYGAAGAEIGLKRLEEMGAKNARLAREDAAAKREAEAAAKKTAPAAGAAKKPKDTNAQDLASKQARKTK